METLTPGLLYFPKLSSFSRDDASKVASWTSPGPERITVRLARVADNQTAIFHSQTRLCFLSDSNVYSDENLCDFDDLFHLNFGS